MLANIGIKFACVSVFTCRSDQVATENSALRSKELIRKALIFRRYRFEKLRLRERKWQALGLSFW